MDLDESSKERYVERMQSQQRIYGNETMTHLLMHHFPEFLMIEQ